MKEMDIQTRPMIEKSEGVWKCKVCGKSSKDSGNIRRHAETHIEGLSYACHICSKNYPNRNGLRVHINMIHSELLCCDLCGKTGMNKKSYYDHKKKHHKTSSGTLS